MAYQPTNPLCQDRFCRTNPDWDCENCCLRESEDFEKPKLDPCEDCNDPGLCMTGGYCPFAELNDLLNRDA